MYRRVRELREASDLLRSMLSVGERKRMQGG